MVWLLMMSSCRKRLRSLNATWKTISPYPLKGNAIVKNK
jgi:hypothetical protein